jgi:hypothetical protein
MQIRDEYEARRAPSAALGVSAAVLGTFADYFGVIGLFRDGSINGGISFSSILPRRTCWSASSRCSS